jgi:hypothetical protein
MDQIALPIVISMAGVYTIVSLFNGSNQLVRGTEPRMKSFRIFLLGVTGFVVFGSGAFWFASTYDRVTDTILSSIQLKAPQFSKELRSKLSANDIEKLTRLEASIAFSREGRLIEYTGSNGEQSLYRPSQAEISQREGSIKQVSAIEAMNSGFKSVAVAIIMTGALAIILGLLEGLFARVKAKRHTQVK